MEVCSQCGTKVPKKEPLVEHRDYSDANAELVPWGQYDEDFFRLQCWTTAFDAMFAELCSNFFRTVES